MGQLTSLLGLVFHDCISLFLPNLCMLCDTPLDGKEKYICHKCWMTLPIFPDRSGVPLRPLRGVLDRLWIGWEYDQRLRRIIHLFKYHSRPEFAELLIREWLKTVPRPVEIMNVDFIVPVPIHPARRRFRGFNQSERLASNLAVHFNLQIKSEYVKRIINTPSQTTLGRGERWRSVEQAFAVPDADVFQGKNVLIVDDLVTSGATLHALVTLLSGCGTAAVSAAVLTAPSPEGQVI